MAIDVEGKRRSGADSIREAGKLIDVRQAVFVNDERTGEEEFQTWALIESFSPREINGTTIQGSDSHLTMAALRWVDGAWGGVIHLKQGDKIKFDGTTWVPVINPGSVQPSGEPILYEAHVGNRRQAA